MIRVSRSVQVATLLALFVGLLSGPASAEEPEPTPEQGSTCLLKVIEDANGVQAGLDGLLTQLTQVSDDPASPAYEGTLLSLPLKVTLWRGAPAEEVEDAVSAGVDEWDDLAEQSLGEVVEGELPADGVEHEGVIDSPATTAALETVAYRAQLGPLVEFGTKASASAGSLLGCLPAIAATLSTVTLNSPLGVFSLPKSDTVDEEIEPAVFEGDGLKPRTVPIFAGDSMVRYLTAASAPSTTSVIRYRTFIPTSTVTTKYVCGTFKGDNRGFSNYYSKGARTRVSVFYDWPGRTMSYSTNIGTTHRLAAYGFSAASRTASSSGIKLSSAVMYSTYGRVLVNHAIKNPLCGPAGPIAYSLVFEAWKNGAARLQGTRRKVPNHEAYLYPKSGANGNTILRRSTSNYMCLNLNCGDESVSETTD